MNKIFSLFPRFELPLNLMLVKFRNVPTVPPRRDDYLLLYLAIHLRSQLLKTAKFINRSSNSNLLICFQLLKSKIVNQCS